MQGMSILNFCSKMNCSVILENNSISHTSHRSIVHFFFLSTSMLYVYPVFFKSSPQIEQNILILSPRMFPARLTPAHGAVSLEFSVSYSSSFFGFLARHTPASPFLTKSYLRTYFDSSTGLTRPPLSSIHKVRFRDCKPYPFRCGLLSRFSR